MPLDHCAKHDKNFDKAAGQTCPGCDTEKEAAGEKKEEQPAEEKKEDEEKPTDEESSQHFYGRSRLKHKR